MRRPDTYRLPSMSSLSRPLHMGRPVVSMGAGWGKGAVGAEAVAYGSTAYWGKLPGPAEKTSGDKCHLPSALPSMAALTSWPEARLTWWAFQNGWLWIFDKPGWLAAGCSTQAAQGMRGRWIGASCSASERWLGEQRSQSALPGFPMPQTDCMPLRCPH